MNLLSDRTVNSADPDQTAPKEQSDPSLHVYAGTSGQ